MLSLFTPAEAEASILRRRGPLDVFIPPGLQESLSALFGRPTTPEQAVKQILQEIKDGRDEALKRWMLKIDRIEAESFAIPPAELAAAAARIPAELHQALTLAADRIRAFHALQPLPNWTTDTLGGTLGQRATPIQRVGVYVPGGTAPLPSSLLMGVVPAQVAGVPEIVVVTPPGRDGRVPDVTLAAAAITGIEEIYMLGGAQAVAALGYGTESIRAVDKIVGPGNLFVTLAKRELFGIVGVDGLYGPTETLVIADESANPEWIAADLLAQAEHDVLATAILLTPSRAVAVAVQREVARQLAHLSRADIVRQALAGQGGIVLTADLAEAARLADAFAAEHLCLAVADPAGLARRIHSAGGLFFGEQSFEVLGDYVAGPSHTMPTAWTARYASPLNVYDFIRINSIIALDPNTAARLSPVAALIAEAEALTAHAHAARLRVSAAVKDTGNA